MDCSTGNGSRKASGPDGFNAGWLKRLWPHISEKILEFFFSFFMRNLQFLEEQILLSSL